MRTTSYTRTRRLIDAMGPARSLNLVCFDPNISAYTDIQY